MSAQSHEQRQAALRKQSSGRLMIFGFLSPTLAILIFMVAYPIFSLIYYSFFNFSALRQGVMKPVGLKTISSCSPIRSCGSASCSPASSCSSALRCRC